MDVGKVGNHGIYSGAGSITGYGGNNDYDFTYQPIDKADAIAKRHGYGLCSSSRYDYAGYIEDVRTQQADGDMVNRIDAFMNGEQVEGIETLIEQLTQEK